MFPQKNDIIILGIESSCDETAVAIIKDKKEILSHIVSSQQKEHANYGGVVPELAARRHLENIEIITNQALIEANINLSQISAIAASYAPGLIGGLLVGNVFAKAICAACKLPFIAVNHLEAHILMPLMLYEIEFPFLAVLISGGNSQVIYAKNCGYYKVLGKTLDDSVGEALDKIGLMMGFNYPAGPIIENYAKYGDETKFKLPMPICKEKNSNFSFSGLKTFVKLLIEKQTEITEQFKQNLCASLQFTISNILINRIKNALDRYNNLKTIIISGGVASNKYINNKITEYFSDYNVIYPPRNLCTDNGVMIAWNGILKYKKGYFETFDCEVEAKINLK